MNARVIEQRRLQALNNRLSDENTTIIILPHQGIVDPVSFRVNDNEVVNWQNELEAKDIPYDVVVPVKPKEEVTS